MASYIKTEDALPYLTKYVQTVEAVELSKINKAIKEMNNIDLVMSCEEMRDYCVEILKRNIEEE